MDVLQIVLITLILVATIVFTVLGFQLFLIFRKLQQSVDKVGQILSDARNIAEEVKKPLKAVTDLSTIVGTGMKVVKVLNQNKQVKRRFKKSK